MKSIKIAFYSLILILLTNCTSKNVIVGEWECYDDPYYNGQLIKIEKFGESFNGIRMNLIGDDYLVGWRIGDVCWKNITLIEEVKYKLTGISKGLRSGVDPVIGESDQFIIMENKNTLLIKNFVSDQTKEGEGRERRYKRIN